MGTTKVRKVKGPGESRIAQFLFKRLEELKPVKNQVDIAREAGYKTSNVISMLKHGESKVPLDRVPGLAKALDVDPMYLFEMALEQFYEGKSFDDLKEMFFMNMTPQERELLQGMRHITGRRDYKVDDGLMKVIEAHYQANN